MRQRVTVVFKLVCSPSPPHPQLPPTNVCVCSTGNAINVSHFLAKTKELDTNETLKSAEPTIKNDKDKKDDEYDRDNDEKEKESI